MEQFHLTKTDNTDGDYSIKQGETFDWLILTYPGDITATATPRGQIRKKYADLDEDILATFNFDTLTYDEIEDYTIIHPTLSATITEALEAPSKKRTTVRDAVVIGVNVFVYDIELEFNNNRVERICQGYVEVSREVTR